MAIKKVIKKQVALFGLRKLKKCIILQCTLSGITVNPTQTIFVENIQRNQNSLGKTKGSEIMR